LTSPRSRRDERLALGIHRRCLRGDCNRDRRHDVENPARLSRAETCTWQNGRRRCGPRWHLMSSAATGTSRRGSRWLLFLPVAVFAALAALFFIRLYAGDAALLPSALIGRAVPHFDLPPLPAVQ